MPASQAYVARLHIPGSSKDTKGDQDNSPDRIIMPDITDDTKEGDGVLLSDIKLVVI